MYAVRLIRIEKIWFNFIFSPSWSFNEWFTNLLVQSTAVPHTFNNMKWKMKFKKRGGKSWNMKEKIPIQKKDIKKSVRKLCKINREKNKKKERKLQKNHRILYESLNTIE